jgi:hypothetical protein
MSKQHNETPEIEEIEPEGKSWKERGKLVLFGAMMSLGIFSAMAGLPIPAVVGLFAGMYIAANYKGEEHIHTPTDFGRVRHRRMRESMENMRQQDHEHDMRQHHQPAHHEESSHHEDKSWVKATERSHEEAHHER